MNQSSLLLILALVTSIEAYSIKESFRSNCSQLDGKNVINIGGLYGPEPEWNCSICENLTIKSSDSEIFEQEELNISSGKCFIFEGGDVGVVNADFFKQFPNAIYIIFKKVRISLKSSKNLLPHGNLKYLEFFNSNISESNQTNALYSLQNLSALEISSCFMQNTTIDSELLKRNVNLQDLSIVDDDLTHPSNHSSTIKNIEEDALEYLINLRTFYIQVRNMTRLPKKLLQNKPKLNDLSIGITCSEIPEEIDNSVKGLQIYFCKIKQLTRNDLRRFKKLQSFELVKSGLETIDEDAFDDLTNLSTLYLESNELRSFTPRHLQCNPFIRYLSLEDNPIENFDSKSLRLEEAVDYPGIYERKA